MEKRYGKLEIKLLTYYCDDIQRLFDLTIKAEENIFLAYAKQAPIIRKRKKKKRILRDEAVYNLIRKNHFYIYFNYMPLAIHWASGHKTLWKGNGRPPKRLSDMLVCLHIWQKFPSLDCRDAHAFLEFLKYYGIIEVEVPCFKTLCNYKNNPCIKTYLDELIKITSKPFNKIEKDFATDMTGIKTRTFTSWYSIRTGETIEKRDHISTHITTGVRSNIVTAVDVCVKSGRDNEILRKHVDITNENFEINNWSGDSRYWCKKNCRKLRDVDGKAWFWPHENFSGKYVKCGVFNRMSRALLNKEENALKSYHKRSNVESTIHSKKCKLGDFVRSRLEIGQEQEEHIKWVNYNFAVLGRALFEWDIVPDFLL